LCYKSGDMELFIGDCFLLHPLFVTDRRFVCAGQLWLIWERVRHVFGIILFSFQIAYQSVYLASHMCFILAYIHL